jgi:voltage-gated potassium channel
VARGVQRPGATITTFRDDIWWAIVTTTTVGYGDYTPVTAEGRVIATVVMIVGVGLIGTVSAIRHASQRTPCRTRRRRIGES